MVNEPTCFSPLYTGEIKTEQPENYRFKTFFTPHWGSIAVGIEKYLHPEMKVTTTIDAHPKCPAQLLADGNEKTFFRSNRRVKDGDTVLFEFEKPLDCRKITIKSGSLPDEPIISLPMLLSKYLRMESVLYVPAGSMPKGTVK